MSKERALVAPSLLSCDFGRLRDEIGMVEDAGADWLHVDVMDGHFVPNLTVGPVVVEAIRRKSHIPIDVHLMIDHPEQYAKQFLDAGASLLTVHVEASGLRKEKIAHDLLKYIRRAGAKSGLSVRPKTGVEMLLPYLPELDLALVMSVEPGFGGQTFMPGMIPKVKALRGRFQGYISVDGGITGATSKSMREAGADVLVAGTYVFRSKSYRKAIQTLRGQK